MGRPKLAFCRRAGKSPRPRSRSVRLRTQHVKAAVSERNNVRVEIDNAEKQRQAVKAVVDRIMVHSPSHGIIVKMAVNSRGGVARPGDTLLELLPTASDLVIEARVLPQDVDVIKVGQEARLRFGAQHPHGANGRCDRDRPFR